MNKSKFSVLELIGNTPLVKVRHFDTGLCDLYVKLENRNPGGSIKDRIAKQIIEDAEKRGDLKPGGLIVEATAGNTGLGLAVVAKLKGYKLICVVFDKASEEKIELLRTYGAEIVIAPAAVPPGHPDYYTEVAARICKEKNAFATLQFENKSNSRAHELGTGPEIFEQTNGAVDAVVCGIGSGGTISGLHNYFKNKKPSVEMILADPKGSILAEYVNNKKLMKAEEAGSWLVEGIGQDYLPKLVDFSTIKKAYTVDDKEAFTLARELFFKEGILGGSTTGTLFASALHYCREQKSKKTVVTFACDDGSRYLSKLYNNEFLSKHQLL